MKRFVADISKRLRGARPKGGQGFYVSLQDILDNLRITTSDPNENSRDQKQQ